MTIAASVAVLMRILLGHSPSSVWLPPADRTASVRQRSHRAPTSFRVIRHAQTRSRRNLPYSRPPIKADVEMVCNATLGTGFKWLNEIGPYIAEHAKTGALKQLMNRVPGGKLTSWEFA